MANQTVSTSKNYDDASILGLVDGDTLTVDSLATLTIDSDMRWGQQNAVPTAITVTAATGGTVFHDGTKVWQVPFSASTGNVPALGTVGVQNCNGGTSGATGEFLGVWATGSLNPTAAAVAMPATGYLKFRSKVGTFNATAETITLPSGATITTTNAGKRSWLNACYRNSNNNITTRRLGNGLICTGDWYEVGTLAGTANETLQMPVGDVFGGIFIEKTPGSAATVKDYTTLDRWVVLPAAAFTAINVAGDDRGLFYTCSTGGLITFGNGSVGQLPPAGCKVFVGNIIFSSAAAGAYATNTLTNAAGTRASFVANQSNVSIDKCVFCGWQLTFTAYTSLLITNSVWVDSCALTSSNGDWTVDHCIGGSYLFDQSPLLVTTCFTGNGLVRDVSVARLVSPTINNCFNIEQSRNVTVTRLVSGAGRKQGRFSQCTNLVCDLLQVVSGIIFFGCVNARITNTLACGSPVGVARSTLTAGSSSGTAWTLTYAAGHSFKVGESIQNFGCTPAAYNATVTVASVTATTVTITTTSNPGTMTVVGYSSGASQYSLQIAGGTNVLVDGVSYGFGVSIPSFTSLVDFAGNGSNVRVRNLGTRSAPLDLQGITVTPVAVNGTLKGRISNVFALNPRGVAWSLASTSDDIAYNDLGAYATAAAQRSAYGSNNGQMKRCAQGGAKTFGNSTGQIENGTSNLGCHFHELVTGATETLFGIVGSEKSIADPSAYAYQILAGTPRFDGTLGLIMSTLNDAIEYTSYWILGVTGFSNTAPLTNATNRSNHTVTYDLDKGTGFSGSYKTVNAANLSAETDILATGLRIKIKIVCNTSSVTNAIQDYFIYMVSSDTLRTANPYPHNEPKCDLSGGISGSYLSVFDTSTGTWVATNPTTASYAYVPWFSDVSRTFRLRRPGYQFVEIAETVTEDGFSIPVVQTALATIPATDSGALSITVTNHGVSPVTWQGKQWSISIVNTGGHTAAQIANYINFNTARDWPALGGNRGNAWPEMIVENESNLETKRGTLFGSTGASLKGIRIVDGSDNAIVGFARMQADDGTYYLPPATATLTVSGFVTGSDVIIYNASVASTGDGSNVIQTNDSVAGTSVSYTYTYVPGTTVDVGVFKNGYKPTYVRGIVLSTTNATIPINQPGDPSYVS